MVHELVGVQGASERRVEQVGDVSEFASRCRGGGAAVHLDGGVHMEGGVRCTWVHAFALCNLFPASTKSIQASTKSDAIKKNILLKKGLFGNFSQHVGGHHRNSKNVTLG